MEGGGHALYAVLLPVGRSGDRIVFPVVEPIRGRVWDPVHCPGGGRSALHSYRDRERKLEILKDSHIGAFAVICFVMYELIYLGAVSMITEKEQILVLAAGFFLSRTLSGIGVVSLCCAKTNGMLYQFASEAHRRVVLTALYLQLVLCVGLMLAVSVKTGALACAAAGLTYAYYRQKSYREFGGITGDLAGYFVTLCEGVMAVLVAAAGLIG